MSGPKPKATDLFGPDLPDLDLDAGMPEASIFELFGDGDEGRPENPLPWSGRTTNKSQYAHHLKKFLPVGKGQAIDGASLARCLGMPWERTEGPLRGLVRTFTVVFGWPICVTMDGGVTRFYLIDTNSEATDFIEYLTRRIEALTDQRDAIEKGWARRRAEKQQGGDWP